MQSAPWCPMPHSQVSVSQQFKESERIRLWKNLFCNTGPEFDDINQKPQFAISHFQGAIKPFSPAVGLSESQLLPSAVPKWWRCQSLKWQNLRTRLTVIHSHCFQTHVLQQQMVPLLGFLPVSSGYLKNGLTLLLLLFLWSLLVLLQTTLLYRPHVS